MNWLTNFVPPKLRQLVVRDTPENLWLQCPNCSQMLFHRDLEKAHKVCTHCGHHMRLGAKERLALMFDDGAYTLADLPPVQSDPLRFRDQKRYVDRMKDAQSKTGLQDAVLVAEGTIGGMPAVAAAFAFEFMGGSMGIAVGDAILRAARLAVEKRAALIAIPASGGARMQEGILSLMQMPRTTVAVAEVREAGLPYIVVMTDPTTGGVSASFAMLGDIAISEPGAAIGFAGQRVIRETIRETLPEGFQRAEYLFAHGMLDMVVHRHEMRETLGRILGMLMHRVEAEDPIADELSTVLPDEDVQAPSIPAGADAAAKQE
ncbi:acetyl-CoA carboxylase carboxyl transferase subunit beta [Constrictibacter sp. MBR-5]|jgi:acetyl-CoA carboxylase carboxyl transferase subunit beta|uniref:acetyl-CoA carboxylase, carboxyltransferase subunit beta n=1 Tax=Constrictibacter sp. MBR-5 TaxID=3156467 RepID=UPI0033980FB0